VVVGGSAVVVVVVVTGAMVVVIGGGRVTIGALGAVSSGGTQLPRSQLVISSLKWIPIILPQTG